MSWIIAPLFKLFLNVAYVYPAKFIWWLIKLCFKREEK